MLRGTEPDCYFSEPPFVRGWIEGPLREDEEGTDETVSDQTIISPVASVLAWRIPGTGEPGGLPSMGSHRVGHD